MFECVKVVYNALASKTSSELWRGVAGAAIVSSVYSLILYLTVSTKSSSVDALHHERGHNWQLMMMGIANYGFMIGLQSWREWSTRQYYDRPWDITADVFGSVTGRTHSQADINRGYWFLAVSSLFGPLGYLCIIGKY